MPLIYYLIIKPLSLLPLWILHRISDVMFLIVYYAIPYRKSVVLSNIRIAFPELSEKERTDIAKRFYRNFCDVIVESVKSFSISESELRKRFVMEGRDLLLPYYEQGKSIIGLSSHVANYEWMIICDTYYDHRCAGIITPLSNPFLYQKILKSRSQFGTRLIPKREVRDAFANEIEPTLYFFGSDQSPHKANRAYWTTFFGVRTAVQYGAEKYAIEHNIPVFHFFISRLRRGYYRVTCQVLEANPVHTQHGEIMKTYCHQLESHIRNNKSDWLWTHRRWKHSDLTQS